MRRSLLQQNGYSYGYVKEEICWEFRTTFAQDASLTTSTMYFLTDIKSRRIFPNSYPGMGIAQLYRWAGLGKECKNWRSPMGNLTP
ncbi:MAG: hypothetical protein EBE86_012830 [Hormoscilla sp. GUM202]|nr:hypothetical protein [Hormoscilla sp. GUM202]